MNVTGEIIRRETILDTIEKIDSLRDFYLYAKVDSIQVNGEYEGVSWCSVKTEENGRLGRLGSKTVRIERNEVFREKWMPIAER